MIEEAVLEAIRQRVDIVALVGEQVALRKVGANYFGLCPFHKEKTPSFSVHPGRGRYHCFGCGADGDIFEFVKQTQGLDFVEAVTLLGQRVGVAVERKQIDERAREQQRRLKRLQELVALAHERAQQALERLFEQGPADLLSYLNQRGLSREVTRRHGLGWAAQDWLLPWEKTRADELCEAGLAQWVEQPQGHKRLLARMRHRLLFPIRNERGDVVGFGGRLIPSESVPAVTSAAKYINTPQTALYRKSEVLYRLYEARSAMVKARRALVVEGYMDALSLTEAGFAETVACCGTALTAEQLGRLMKATEEVVFVFDGDEAGRRAAWRAARLCLQHYRADRRMRFLLLPQGLDPDDLVRAQGEQGMLQQLERTMDLSEFVLRWLKQQHNGLKSVEDRAGFLASVKQVLAPLGPQADFARLMLKEAYSLVSGSQSSQKLNQRPTSSMGHRRAASGPCSWALPSPWRIYPQYRQEWALNRGLAGAAAAYPWTWTSSFVSGSQAKESGLMSAARSASSPLSYWQRLEQAIAAAPSFAYSMRQTLLQALDETRAVESGLKAILQKLPPQGVSERKEPMWAQDLLRAAPRTIPSKRTNDIIDELRQMRDAGEISEDDFLETAHQVLKIWQRIGCATH